MAVGLPLKTTYADGDVYSASDVNDTNGTINAYLAPSLGYSAGKNKIINGDFYLNQRNFTTGNTDGVYGFDRWRMNLSGGTATYTAQTFTAGAAPVAGYEGKNYAKVTVTTGNDFLGLLQRVEDVRNFAGQTITVSFWAKGVNPTTNNGLYVWLVQSFGTGGSPSANVVTESSKITLSASWARYSVTINVPSISGKTFGTTNDSYLQVSIGQASNASTDAWTLEVWGVQVESGSTATAFQTATGTIQGELAACQRYYIRTFPELTSSIYGMGLASSTTQTEIVVNLPTTMRINPSSFDSASIQVSDGVTGYSSGTFLLSTTRKSPNVGLIIYQHGSAALTQFRPYRLENASTTAGYLGFSAEL
jgi:hypothetical protein